MFRLTKRRGGYNFIDLIKKKFYPPAVYKKSCIKSRFARWIKCRRVPLGRGNEFCKLLSDEISKYPNLIKTK